MIVSMTEVTKGVHYVDGSNANCYLVEEADGSLTLIDTGLQNDGKKILNHLTVRMARKPSDVKTIVLTHGHVDHVGGAASIKAATGAKLVVHEAEADFVTGRSKYPAPRGGMRLVFGLLSPFFHSTPVQPDSTVKENDRVGKLLVVHTPGHTPGSISLYDKEGKVLFVGDAARFLNGKLVGAPPQFTPEPAQAAASIEKLGNLDFELMLSGHGDPLKSTDAPSMMKQLAKDLQTGK